MGNDEREVTDERRDGEYEEAMLDEGVRATEALECAENQLGTALLAVRAMVDAAAAANDMEALMLIKNVTDGAKATRPGLRQMLDGFRALAKLIEQRPAPIHISLPVESEKKP